MLPSPSWGCQTTEKMRLECPVPAPMPEEGASAPGLMAPAIIVPDFMLAITARVSSSYTLTTFSLPTVAKR
jgi:hypothetical protein